MNYLLISAECALIYILIIICFRLLGKKGFAELSIADLVLVILIGEALGSIFPEEVNKFIAALVCIVTLVIVNYTIEQLNYRSSSFRKLIEGEPVTIIKDGKKIRAGMKKEKVTDDDIEEAMRYKGIDDIEKVKKGVLETDGKISIILK